MPIVVQSSSTNSFGTTPTAGNLLFAASAHRNDPATPVFDSGFSVVAVDQFKTGDGDRRGVAIAMKVSDGTEGTVTVSAPWAAPCLMEVDPETSGVTVSEGGTANSGTTAVTSLNVPTNETTAHWGVGAIGSRDDALVFEAVAPWDFVVSRVADGVTSSLFITPLSSAALMEASWTNLRHVCGATVTLPADVYTLSGTVTKDAVAVQGARVVVVSNEGEEFTLRGSTLTAADGTWSIGGIPAAELAHAMAFWDDAGTLHTAEGRPFIEEPGP